MQWLGKPVPEILISELADHFDFPILMLQRDGRMFDAVENRRLHHRVVGHVVEDQDVADHQRAGKGEVAGDVAGEGDGALFKLVAVLTGSKNALKGVGFFVGAALLWALERGLGSEWTPEVKRAWGELYLFIEGVMKREVSGTATA